MNVLIINGPNLNLLGEREPGTYGSDSYKSICAEITEKAAELARQDGCLYIVLAETKPIDGTLEEYGYEKYAETDGYVIYRDTVTKKK